MSASSAHHPVGTGTSVVSGLRLRVPAEATAGSITVHEGVLAPAEAVPLHVHDEADQLLYVVEGKLEVTVGDGTFTALPGDLVAKPHGVPHGFASVGSEQAQSSRSPLATALSASRSLPPASQTRRASPRSRPNTASTRRAPDRGRVFRWHATRIASIPDRPSGIAPGWRSHFGCLPRARNDGYASAATEGQSHKTCWRAERRPAPEVPFEDLPPVATS